MTKTEKLLFELADIYGDMGTATTTPRMREGKPMKTTIDVGVSRDTAAAFGYRLQDLCRSYRGLPPAKMRNIRK